MDGFHIAPVMLQNSQQQGAQQTHQILQTLNGQQILVPMSSNGQSVQFIQVGGQQLQVLQAPAQTTSVAQVAAPAAPQQQQQQQQHNNKSAATAAGGRVATTITQNQLQGIKQVTQQPGTQLIQTLDGQTLLYQPTMVRRLFSCNYLNMCMIGSDRLSHTCKSYGTVFASFHSQLFCW